MISSGMPPLPPAVRVITRRAFALSLIALAAEAAAVVAIWPINQWRLVILFAAFPTLLFVMTFGLLLAGERWPRLDSFKERRPAVLVAIIGASAIALVMFAIFPDPLVLILAPILLGFFVLFGWAVHKARDYLGI